LGTAGKMTRIVRIAPCLLAHYLTAAYRYGSEELLRALRIAIRPKTFVQVKGPRDVTSAGNTVGGPGGGRFRRGRSTDAMRLDRRGPGGLTGRG